MCWCRIRMVLIGLLGLLCVVHVVSGMCGQTFTDPQSRALMSEVVLEGKVKLLSEPDSDGLFNATVSVRKNVPKGKDLLKLKGKLVRKLNIGRFKAKQDPENCVGALRLGSTYIFFLKKTNHSRGLYFELSSLPLKRSKKKSRMIKKILCDNCAQAPKIKKLTGKQNVTVGSRATIKCAARAMPPPQFEWYKNGVLLTKQKGLHIKAGKRQSRIKIKKAGVEHVGVYTCVVKNAVGTDRKDFSLSVKRGPEYFCERQTYCLNGGVCLYNPALDAQYCDCPKGYRGVRCEQKEQQVLQKSTDQATLIYERTLIIVGLVIAVLFLVAIFIASYILAKRRRRRFEAKRRRKEARRAKEKDQSSPYVTPEKYTSYTPEHKSRQVNANQYGPPPPGKDRLSYDNDNRFDFHNQQTQPLLSQDATDKPASESRRRLVASSVYDNTDEPPTIWPSSVQGLTTAEVLTTPEAIEMDQLPSKSQSNDIEEPKPLQNQQPPHHSSSSPLPPYDPPAPQQPPVNDITNQQTAPVLPVSRHEITSSPSDHPTGPHRNSQLSNNDLDIAAADSSVVSPPPPPPPPLRSYPHYDQPEPQGRESEFPNYGNSFPPVSPKDLESPNKDSRNLSGRQNVDEQGSPPSYQSAIMHLGQPSAMMLSTDTDSDDDNREQDIIQNMLNGLQKELHISEEDLNLSRENTVTNSFNSLSNPSRQVSIDGDLQNGTSPTEPFIPKFRKHQSDDITNAHLWKNPLLPVESPRSHSLDTPGPISKEEERLRKKYHNQLSSTLADSQDVQPDTMGRLNHVENSFDPSDDASPWDSESSRRPDYLNIMSEEQDRLNRLKDVCPDQPAIPI